jgi:hypothetical protein
MADINITMPGPATAAGCPSATSCPAMRALDAGVKRHVWVWHRRAGKDTCAINWAAARWPTGPPPSSTSCPS